MVVVGIVGLLVDIYPIHLIDFESTHTYRESDTAIEDTTAGFF